MGTGKEILEWVKEDLNEALEKLEVNKGIKLSLKLGKDRWNLLERLIDKFQDYDNSDVYLNFKLSFPLSSGKSLAIEIDVYYDDNYEVKDPQIEDYIDSPNNLKVANLLISANLDYSYFFSRKTEQEYFSVLLFLKKLGFNICHDEVLKVYYYPFIEFKLRKNEYKLVEYII
jgi:hypothetical protein